MQRHVKTNSMQNHSGKITSKWTLTMGKETLSRESPVLYAYEDVALDLN
jgi:hypothetical protein